MFKSLTTRALFASAVLALVALVPATSMASEGARSVGKGMKCSTRAVQQADGTITYQYICYKSI